MIPSAAFVSVLETQHTSSSVHLPERLKINIVVERYNTSLLKAISFHLLLSVVSSQKAMKCLSDCVAEIAQPGSRNITKQHCINIHVDAHVVISSCNDEGLMRLLSKSTVFVLKISLQQGRNASHTVCQILFVIR